MVTLVTRCRTFSPIFWRQTTWTFVCYYTKILSHSPIEFADLNNETNWSTLIMKRRVLQFCIQARRGVQVRVAEVGPIVFCGWKQWPSFVARRRLTCHVSRVTWLHDIVTLGQQSLSKVTSITNIKMGEKCEGNKNFIQNTLDMWAIYTSKKK